MEIPTGKACIGRIVMRENWYALFVAIEREVTVEQAFEIYAHGELKNKLITKDDERDMQQMKKQGMTYKDIGKIYGVTACTVCHRIKLKMEMV